MADFTRFSDAAPFKLEFPPLDGTIVILWALTYAPSPTQDSIPYSGICYRDGRTMLFFMHDGSQPFSKAVYHIYDLSPESREEITADHRRFQSIAGVIHDYIPDRVKSFERNFQGMFKYQPDFDMASLQVKYLGRVESSQVENRYPHVKPKTPIPEGI